jgi:hypothetical protein
VLVACEATGKIVENIKRIVEIRQVFIEKEFCAVAFHTVAPPPRIITKKFIMTLA